LRYQLFVFAIGLGATAVKNQGVVQHIEFEQIAYHRLDVVNSRVAKLHHLVAVRADQVVVLPVTVRLFVLGRVLPELVLYHQVAVYQDV
jgi:hypothetical protein